MYLDNIKLLVPGVRSGDREVLVGKSRCFFDWIITFVHIFSVKILPLPLESS